MVLLFEPQSTVAACANFCVLILEENIKQYTVRFNQYLCIQNYWTVKMLYKVTTD